jgi:hypothetical protein
LLGVLRRNCDLPGSGPSQSQPGIEQQDAEPEPAGCWRQPKIESLAQGNNLAQTP